MKTVSHRRPFIWTFRIGKSREVESRFTRPMQVLGGNADGCVGMVMVAQFWEYTTNHWTLHGWSGWCVNYIKAVTKKFNLSPISKRKSEACGAAPNSRSHMRSLYASHFFLRLSNIPWYVCVYICAYKTCDRDHIFFIHSPANRHVGCFHTLTTVNEHRSIDSSSRQWFCFFWICTQKWTCWIIW